MHFSSNTGKQLSKRIIRRIKHRHTYWNLKEQEDCIGHLILFDSIDSLKIGSPQCTGKTLCHHCFLAKKSEQWEFSQVHMPFNFKHQLLLDFSTYIENNIFTHYMVQFSRERYAVQEERLRWCWHIWNRGLSGSITLYCR